MGFPRLAICGDLGISFILEAFHLRVSLGENRRVFRPNLRKSSLVICLLLLSFRVRIGFHLRGGIGRLLAFCGYGVFGIALHFGCGGFRVSLDLGRFCLGVSFRFRGNGCIGFELLVLQTNPLALLGLFGILRDLVRQLFRRFRFCRLEITLGLRKEVGELQIGHVFEDEERGVHTVGEKETSSLQAKIVFALGFGALDELLLRFQLLLDGFRDTFHNRVSRVDHFALPERRLLEALASLLSFNAHFAHFKANGSCEFHLARL